jgi:hypothetical protein
VHRSRAAQGIASALPDVAGRVDLMFANLTT